LTGSIRGGKTTVARKIIEMAGEAGITAGGILSERVTDGSRTTGYDIVNIGSGERERFLREEGDCNSGRIGRFRICRKGLSAGRKILDSFIDGRGKLIIIDEVGLLELQDGGWAASIKSLLDRSPNHILMTVRDVYVREIKRKWNIRGVEVINISESDPESTAKLILEKVALKRDTVPARE
jgi:nucleoside-triphosphatase THEP1